MRSRTQSPALQCPESTQQAPPDYQEQLETEKKNKNNKKIHSSQTAITQFSQTQHPKIHIKNNKPIPKKIYLTKRLTASSLFANLLLESLPSLCVPIEASLELVPSDVSRLRRPKQSFRILPSNEIENNFSNLDTEKSEKAMEF